MAELIGVFGGTFDPIHQGHLGAIESLTEQLEFGRIHWVLSARPPHKDQVSASVDHRFTMLELALQGRPDFLADDTEITRTEMSYTFDTVLSFQHAYPNAPLCVIIGADSMHKLHTWHRYDELVEQVNFIVINRPGYDLATPEELRPRLVSGVAELANHAAGKIAIFKSANFDVSSTELRNALTGGDTHSSTYCEKYLDSRVYDYIRQHQLYKIPTMNSEQLKDQVVDALENIKGQEVKVIDIADISDFADYMVVVSGTSDTHVRALAREASDHLRKQGVKPLNQDGADIGEWVLVDFGDVVLHVMRPEVREYYDLEKLWDEDVRNMVKQHREQQDG